MAIREILEFPDPRLRTVARPVERFDEDLAELVEDLFETMYDAPGIGLAATQVNVHQRLLVKLGRGERQPDGGFLAGAGLGDKRCPEPELGLGKVVVETFERIQGAGGQAGSGRSSGKDYRFGGEFWVVMSTEGGTRPEIRRIRTGITDLDRVEIIEGLEESESVLVLPSSHLVETQQDLQNFLNRRIGIPGIQR